MDSHSPLSPAAPRSASRLIIWLIGFFGFLNIYSVQPILPLIIKTFNASPVQAGITVGATIFAIALLSPFIGMLSDAFGRKPVLCVSIFTLTIPTALIPLVPTLQSVILLRFLQGLCIPGIMVIILAYIAEEFDKNAVPQISSLYMSGSVIGGFSGRFITGHLSSLLGWNNAFFILAASTLAGALLMLFCLPPSRNFKPNRNFAETLKILTGHLRNQRLLAACAVGFCILFSLVGIFTYISLLLAKPPFSLSIAMLANIYCVYLIGGGFITPISGRFVVRFGYRAVIICSLFFSMSGAFMTLTPSLLVVVAGLVICSSGVFVCQATTMSFIADTVKEGRSLASGLYFMSYYGGGAAGSWLAGIAYVQMGGWRGAVTAAVSAQILAALTAWFFWKSESAGDRPALR